jgi:hypothetical protein
MQGRQLIMPTAIPIMLLVLTIVVIRQVRSDRTPDSTARRCLTR